MAGSTYGNLFKITTWGESHGAAIGVVVDGCPAGLSLNEEDIQYFPLFPLPENIPVPRNRVRLPLRSQLHSLLPVCEQQDPVQYPSCQPDPCRLRTEASPDTRDIPHPKGVLMPQGKQA